MPGDTEGQKDGWKDRQTLFHRTLLVTNRGPKRKNRFHVTNKSYGTNMALYDK